MSDPTLEEIHGIILTNAGITTRMLAGMLTVNLIELADVLHDEVSSGNLVREMVFVENDTPRPTLAFGWSCPAL